MVASQIPAAPQLFAQRIAHFWIALFFCLTLLPVGYAFPQKSPAQVSTTFWIAFDCISAGKSFPNRDICLMDQNGKHVRRLTSDHLSHNASWSPDGRHLVFIDDERTPKVPDTADGTYNFLLAYWDYLNVPRYLMTMDPNGQNRQSVASIDSSTQSVAWLPEGPFALRISDRRKIRLVSTSYADPLRTMRAYMNGKLEQQLDQYVQDAQPYSHLNRGDEPVDYLLIDSPFENFLPVILLSYPRSKLSIQLQAGPDPSAMTQVMTFDGTISSFSAPFDAAWSSDGKRVAYSKPADSNHSILYVAEVAENGIAGSRALTNDLVYSNGPAWSPDGTRIAFTGISKGRAQITLVNDDGTNLVQLTGDPEWFCSHLTWSPDGNWIAAECKNLVIGDALHGSQLSFLRGSVKDIFLFETNKPDGKTHRLTKCVSGSGPGCGARNPSFAPAGAVVP